jgi:hypothetical protein
MEPEVQPQPIIVPDVDPTPVDQPVPEASASVPVMKKKRTSFKDTLVTLAVILVSAGVGWVLANHNTVVDDAAHVASATPSTSPSASPTPSPTSSTAANFTAIDATLKGIDTDLSTADTSTAAASAAPSDSDTTPSN